MKRSKRYKEAIDNLRRIYNNIDNIAKDASEYICDYIEYDYNNIMKNVIDDYYADYSPRYYNRTKSLYNAYKILNNGKQIGVDFDSKYMPHEHRVDKKSDNYIFHWMFERGYHGGARHELIQEGTHTYMQWRTPTPQAISAGFATGEPYSRWSKKIVPRMKPSPMIRINKELDEYDKTELKNRVRQGLETAFFKYDIIL